MNQTASNSSARKIGVGVNAWVWCSPFDESSVGLIEKAARMGFDAFTMPVEEPELIDVPGVKRALEQNPMRLYISGAYGPNRDLTHEQPKYRQESLDYIEQMLGICQALGVKTLVGPAYSAVGKRRKIAESQRQQEWALAVEGLSKAAEMARAHDVCLAIEPLNRFETDLVNTAAQVKRLVGDINHSSAKIHLDSFHMNIEEESLYDAIVLAGEDLIYFDASESHRGTPGKGTVPWSEIVRALNDIAYQGDCIIESFTPECEVIADAAAIWRPLASSQDALAEDGCDFLKKMLA